MFAACDLTKKINLFQKSYIFQTFWQINCYFTLCDIVIVTAPNPDKQVCAPKIWPIFYTTYVTTRWQKTNIYRQKGNLIFFFAPTSETINDKYEFRAISSWTKTPHCYFTRLNLKKMGPLQFCLPVFLGIHRNPKQKEFSNSLRDFWNNPNYPILST